VPEAFPHPTVGDCATWLGRSFGATLLAVRTGGELTVSPPWDRPVPVGATLYYVASSRIEAARLTGR
jgi:voltage-gated potassium channel